MAIEYICCKSTNAATFVSCEWSESINGYALQIGSCASGLCISGVSMLYTEDVTALVDGDSFGVCADLDSE